MTCVHSPESVIAQQPDRRFHEVVVEAKEEGAPQVYEVETLHGFAVEEVGQRDKAINARFGRFDWTTGSTQPVRLGPG
jgi:hypothetical protein